MTNHHPIEPSTHRHTLTAFRCRGLCCWACSWLPHPRWPIKAARIRIGRGHI